MLDQAPKELWVFIISALPVLELRAGIPLGLSFKLDPGVVFFLAVLGNSAPIVPILLLLEPITEWLMKRSEFFNRVLERLFEKTRHKHSARMEKYGTIGLAIFVAVPAPGTGAWSGALAAWLFGIEFRHAVPAIIVGVFVSGIIMMAGSSIALALMKLVVNPVILFGLIGSAGALTFAVVRYRRAQR